MMERNALVHLDSQKLESDVNKHAKTINWLMTMDCAMDAQSMKSFLMENVFVETIM